MTAPAETAPVNGRCSVSFMADGSRITNLGIHVHSDTGLSTRDVREERRTVLHIGAYLSETVAVFMAEADLARLIDVLNEAYTRLACHGEAA
jgi:hypothetical protein